MASETLVLDSVISASNALRNATVGNLDADDGNWATATAGNKGPTVLVGFPSPSGDLIVGTDLQTFVAIVRKNSAGSPTARLELWEANRQLLAGPDVTITSLTGQTVSFTWNAAILSDLSGAGVQAKAVITTNAGTSCDIGYIAWTADREGGASTGTVGATLGDVAVASLGGIALAGTLAVTLASLGLNAAGHKPTDRTATALNGTLGSISGTITGSLTNTGSVDTTLGNIGVSSFATIIQPPFDAVLEAGISAISWSYGKPDSIVRGAYTGARSSILNPWAARWKAHVELPAVQGEDKARTIRSFIAQRTGRTVSFRLPATAVPQNANAGVALSSNAARGATSIQISGATTALKDGQMLTVNGQLLCCVADQSGSTVNFLPPLRQAAAAGTIVVTSEPYARMFLANSAASWTVGKERMFKFTLDVEEAVLVHDDPPPETLNDTGHVMKTLASLGLTAAGALKITGSLAKTLGALSVSSAASHLATGDDDDMQWGPLRNEAPSANFATLNTRNLHPTLDFDDTTAESAVFTGVMPASYAGTGITVTIFWAGATATSGNVMWQAALEAVAAGSQDTDSDGFATAQAFTAAAANGTSGVITKSSLNISNGANMDSITAGDLFRLKITRDASNASDTMTGDAQVLAVTAVPQ